ncbi:MAG: hypothetical protein IPO53_02425 [Chitinophagaceae bacterium]|nr:hypothetical protein [Chitinophagaceae bacterium]
MQSLYTLLLAAACYGICYFAFMNLHGIVGMTLRSLVFLLLYVSGTLYLKLSPDIQPVIRTLQKKIGIKKD